MAAAVPGIAYLDGQRLSRGLLAGIARMAADAEHLNRINVFPVPDGDTGTNLAVMLGAVRSALLRHRERHAGKLLEIVADAALDGARGNSGAILAQFFHGVCDASLDHRLLTTDAVIAATRTYALLGNLDHAVRGGRVAPSKRLLAKLLRLEPRLATRGRSCQCAG